MKKQARSWRPLKKRLTDPVLHAEGSFLRLDILRIQKSTVLIYSAHIARVCYAVSVCLLTLMLYMFCNANVRAVTVCVTSACATCVLVLGFNSCSRALLVKYCATCALLTIVSVLAQ